MITCAAGVLDSIAEHARREAPKECCGLLIGGDRRIDEAQALENRAPDPLRRYVIDPREFLSAVKRCRGTTRTVIGAYHSHPRSSANPSETDRAEAFDGFLYLIAGPVGGHASVPIAAYRFESGNFRAIPLVPDAKERET